MFFGDLGGASGDSSGDSPTVAAMAPREGGAPGYITVSSHHSNSLNLQLRVSDPRTIAYFISEFPRLCPVSAGVLAGSARLLWLATGDGRKASEAPAARKLNGAQERP